MAKMTIDGITYEGTAKELAEMVREFSALSTEATQETPKLDVGDYAKALTESEFGDIKAGEIVKITDLDAGESGDPYSVEGSTDTDVCYFRPQGLAKVDAPGDTLTAKVDELDSRVTALEKGDDKPAYKTEKRAAKVGERILITDATQTAGKYSEGDVLTVAEADVPRITGQVGTVYVKEHGRRIYVEEYEVIVEETPAKTAPAKEIEHNGETYTLVSRKAQAGDVVVFTESKKRWVTNDKAYGPSFADSDDLCVRDNDGDSICIYFDEFGRTEANVLVYEKKEPALKVGDYVRVKNGADSRHGDIEAGTIVKVTDTDWDPNHPIRVELLDESDFDYFREHGVELVDLEEGKKAAVFAKAGRKMNEFKRGDIVRVTLGYGPIAKGDIGVIAFADGSDCSKVRVGTSERFVGVELVTPVESRVDNVA